MYSSANFRKGGVEMAESSMRFTFADQLDSIVCYNKSALIEKQTDDYIKIRVQLKLTATAKFFSKISRVRDHKIYVLSGFSFELMKQIMSKPIRLNDLITYLRDTQKLSFFEARALVLDFVAMLMRRGIVAVEVP